MSWGGHRLRHLSYIYIDASGDPLVFFPESISILKYQFIPEMNYRLFLTGHTFSDPRETPHTPLLDLAGIYWERGLFLV